MNVLLILLVVVIVIIVLTGRYVYLNYVITESIVFDRIKIMINDTMKRMEMFLKMIGVGEEVVKQITDRYWNYNLYSQDSVATFYEQTLEFLNRVLVDAETITYVYTILSNLFYSIIDLKNTQTLRSGYSIIFKYLEI